MSYIPSPDILEKYAQVLINFALGGGEGIKRGETVLVQVPEAAKPLYVPLRNTVLKAGGFPIMQLVADNAREADIYQLSSPEQLQFFPNKYLKGLVAEIDHQVMIIAEADKYELKGIDPKKIMRRQNAFKPYRKWRDKKEAAGKFSWTLALYGTAALAKDVKMSEKDYWKQIISACYLDQKNPIGSWRKTYTELERIREVLNLLELEYLTVKAEGIDLKVGLGPHRQWLGGSGRNIPSFELFISPDSRKTEGEIYFNQPLYRYGNVIKGIYLRFHQGRVVEARAQKNQNLLREMISSLNADKIGEYSLTDGRFSKITTIMGDTLFDENMGGPEGNTHLALGNAYCDSYPGDASAVSAKQWREWGYNQSPVHTDIISTASRTVTGYLADGSNQIIYAQGKFMV